MLWLTSLMLISEDSLRQSPSLHAQQGGDGLQVVLDAVVDLLQHGRLDAQLVLFLALLSDVCHPQHHSLELVAVEQRYCFTDEDVILLVSLEFTRLANLHGGEESRLVGAEIVDLALEQVGAEAQALVQALSSAAEVLDVAGGIDYQQGIALTGAGQLREVDAVVQSHFLQQGDGFQDDGASAAMAVAHRLIGLKADGSHHTAFVEEGEDVLGGGSAHDHAGAVALGRALAVEAFEHHRLGFAVRFLALHVLGVHRRDGPGFGFADDDQLIRAGAAVDERIGAAQIGHHGQAELHGLNRLNLRGGEFGTLRERTAHERSLSRLRSRIRKRAWVSEATSRPRSLVGRWPAVGSSSALSGEDIRSPP